MNTLNIKKPVAPIKGRGNKRHPFPFKSNLHADALRVAFWNMLPEEHRAEIGVGVRKCGWAIYERFITPEAMEIWKASLKREAGE